MYTPKALVWQAVRDRNERSKDNDLGFEARYISLIDSLNYLKYALETSMAAMTMEEMIASRKELGEILAKSHLAHYRVASEYSYMEPEYDEICDELFGTNYSAEIIEKEEIDEEIFDDMDF